jgi:hypothetical protein
LSWKGFYLDYVDHCNNGIGLRERESFALPKMHCEDSIFQEEGEYVQDKNEEAAVDPVDELSPHFCLPSLAHKLFEDRLPCIELYDLDVVDDLGEDVHSCVLFPHHCVVEL